MDRRDEPEPRRGTDDIEVTRSEEQLQVVFDRVPYRRIRLVKYVTTDEVTRTVRVRREELRIEPEDVLNEPPIERWAARLTPEEPLEITLSEEQVVIETRVVPRERVRVWVEDVPMGEQLIEGTLRQERIHIIDPRRSGYGESPDEPGAGLADDPGGPVRGRLGEPATDDRPVF